MTTPRRPRAWVDFQVNQNLTTGVPQAVNLLLNATVNLDTITATCIIGRLRAIPSVVANSSVSIQLWSCGIGVASTEAFTIGVTALPDPSVMIEAPPRGWLLREQATLVNQQDSGTVEAWEFPEIRFDVRGQRKIDRGILYMMNRNDDLIAGTTAIKVVGLVRVLCLT